MYDALIVGAGPAGSSLAARLAQRGLQVLVVEQGRLGRDKICGDFVNARGLQQLHALGCIDDVDPQYTPIRRSSTFLGDERIASAELPCLEGLPDHGLVIPRATLDERIALAAMREGAHIVDETRVRAIEHSDTSVLVRTTSKSGTDVHRGHILVGADGAQSFVANSAGRRIDDSRYVIAAQRAYCHGLTVDETIVRFDEDAFPAFGWVFPVRPGLCNVGVGILSESSRKFGLSVRAAFQSLVAFVERLAAERGQQAEVEQPRGWPIKVFGSRQKAVFERGLLVGEAAGQVDPVSGEGIPLALEMSEAASEAIHRALGGAGPNIEQLAQYDDAWQRQHGDDLRLCDFMVEMTRNRHLSATWRSGMRTVANMVNADPDYARTVGGVFAGLLPARSLLEPKVVATGLLRAPLALLEGLARDRGPQGMLAAIAELQGAQLRGALAMLRDPDWSRAWFKELREKHQQLVQTFKGGGA